MSTLTPNQVKDLASTVAGISQHIKEFFDDPENEKAYQEWYLKKYGRNEKECNYEQS